MDRILLSALTAELRAGRRAAMVTVVGTKGSAPRHVGASMLLLEDGSLRGTVGGGAGEGEAIAAARRCLEGAAPCVIEVDKLGSDVAGPEGICGGVSSMLVEAVDAFSALGAAVLAVSRGQAAELLHRLPEGGDFHDLIAEEERLLIFGGGHVGLALARLARDLDFSVIVCDERAEFADSRRFPEGVASRCGTYEELVPGLEVGPADWAVVMTPGHDRDLVCVRLLLSAAPRYLGFIGSARKTRLILEALKAEGNEPSLVEAIRAPIGISIGAETPAEIAISILAELVAERHGAPILEAVAKDREGRRA
ncbi:MAG TPA: XdhC family protein [Rectinemataceae bacterium]|nr:XdhC family protein [Rectinemataceae bacterium]